MHCIAVTEVVGVVVVCNLPPGTPSPEPSDLLDLFFSKGILIQRINWPTFHDDVANLKPFKSRVSL